MVCKICNRECKNIHSLSHHVLLHGLKLIDYYIKYEDFEIPKCPYCGKDCTIRKGINFNVTCGDIECKKKHQVR